MANATVTFHGCIQDSQDFGSDDEHMISRVFFTLEVEGKRYTSLHTDVKQSVGSNFETGSIEVGPPIGYKGSMNHQAFQHAVEDYYRGLVGSRGTSIRITGGSNIRMRNNRFSKEVSVEIEIPSGSTG